MLCALEAISLGEPSKGAVSDEEVIIRVSYDPLHYNKSGALKSNVIRISHLIDGELSVWRLPEAQKDQDDLKQKLQEEKPDGQNVRGLAELSVQDIRKMKSQAGLRLFCIRDDTVIDLDGKKHHLHASIAFCASLGAEYKNKETDEFIYARDLLYNYVKNRLIEQAA